LHYKTINNPSGEYAVSIPVTATYAGRNAVTGKNTPTPSLVPKNEHLKYVIQKKVQKSDADTKRSSSVTKTGRKTPGSLSKRNSNLPNSTMGTIGSESKTYVKKLC